MAVKEIDITYKMLTICNNPTNACKNWALFEEHYLYITFWRGDISKLGSFPKYPLSLCSFQFLPPLRKFLPLSKTRILVQVIYIIIVLYLVHRPCLSISFLFCFCFFFLGGGGGVYFVFFVC